MYLTVQHQPLYRDKANKLVVLSSAQVVAASGALLDSQTKVVLGTDLRPKARTDVVTQDGAPVYRKIALAGQAEVPVTVSGVAIDGGKLITPEGKDALDQALDNAQKAGNLELVKALRQARQEGVLHTKADVEAGLKGADTIQSIGRFYKDVDGTHGLRERLGRRYQTFDEAQAGLAEQKRIQALINSLPTSKAGEQAIVKRMNAKDYATLAAAQEDLEAQQKKDLGATIREVRGKPVAPDGHGLGVDPKRAQVAQEGQRTLEPGLAEIDRTALLQRVEAFNGINDADDYVNAEHIVVDRHGVPKPVAHVKTATGEPVYRRDDGMLTTDIHGGRLPAGVVLVNDQGVRVDERGVER